MEDADNLLGAVGTIHYVWFVWPTPFKAELL